MRGQLIIPARIVTDKPGPSKKTESRKKRRKDAKAQHDIERATETMATSTARHHHHRAHGRATGTACACTVGGQCAAADCSLRLGVLWSPQKLRNASHLGGPPRLEDGQRAGMGICCHSLQAAESLRPLGRAPAECSSPLALIGGQSPRSVASCTYIAVPYALTCDESRVMLVC